MPPKVSYPRAGNQYMFFPDTPSLDKLAIMEACLAGFLDVRRAHQLFNDAMEDPKLCYLLDTKVHNTFLRAYIDYALHIEQQGDAADFWRSQFWALYKKMSTKGYHARPNANTYTIMLFGIMNSHDMPHDDRMTFTIKLLKSMEANKVALSDVVDQTLLTGESGKDLLEILSESAKQTGSRTQVLKKLESIGIVPASEPDLLEGVPEVKTQTKRRVVKKEVDGEEVKVEVFETPYNLGILKDNLKLITESRSSLPDDIVQRQKMLEETAYDSALARFKHEADVFKDLELGGNLTNRSLQAWMWDWH
ncbi:DNA-directed RNA polymerase, partial [Serendipita sp. 399]